MVEPELVVLEKMMNIWKVDNDNEQISSFNPSAQESWNLMKYHLTRLMLSNNMKSVCVCVYVLGQQTDELLDDWRLR